MAVCDRFTRGDEVELAERLRADRYGDHLVFGDGALWHFDGKRYAPLDDQCLRAEMGEYSGSEVEGRRPKLSVSTSKADGAIKMLKSMAIREHGDNYFDAATLGVQFKNGVLRDDGSGKLEINPAQRDDRQRSFIDVDYDASLTCPQFEQFLASCLAGHKDAQERIDLIQEFTGAALFGVAWKLQKALVAQGKGGNGKSVLLDVIGGLFRSEERASVGPRQMSQRFAATELRSKQINIVQDLDSGDLEDTGMVKQVIGGDAIQVDVKFKDPVVIRPRCAHLFACNAWPAIRDSADGFWDRVVPVVFPNRFRGMSGQVHNLQQHLLDAELLSSTHHDVLSLLSRQVA